MWRYRAIFLRMDRKIPIRLCQVSTYFFSGGTHRSTSREQMRRRESDVRRSGVTSKDDPRRETARDCLHLGADQ
jgi:hypothetical protein